MSKDSFYFSHDFNTRNDIKIKKLITKHGYLGYGLFWAIIEELYNNTNVLPTDYDCIAFDLRTEKTLIESIVNDFDLFVVKDNFFGSLSVQRRLDERKEKSIKAKESVRKRWEKYESNTNVLPTNYDRYTIKERKGKENKEKTINIEFYNELLISESWIEVNAKNNRITPEKVKKYLSKFNNNLIAQDDKKNNKKEFMSHFARWLPIELKKDIDDKPKFIPLL